LPGLEVNITTRVTTTSAGRGYHCRGVWTLQS